MESNITRISESKIVFKFEKLASFYLIYAFILLEWFVYVNLLEQDQNRNDHINKLLFFSNLTELGEKKNPHYGGFPISYSSCLPSHTLCKWNDQTLNLTTFCLLIESEENLEINLSSDLTSQEKKHQFQTRHKANGKSRS